LATTATVRVREETRRALAEMAEHSGKTMAEVISELVERARADEILAAHNRAVLSPGVGDEYLAQIASLEGTVADGLEADPWPSDSEGRPER
jgi:uncharacterized protein (DUF1778 family)